MRSSADKTLRKVEDFIGRQAMLDRAAGVLLAVSGGADSVALLSLFLRLCAAAEEAGGQAFWRLHVAHLNHRLRGQESDEDADFVRRLAAASGISCTVGARDVRAYAETNGGGMEAAAREVRYEFLRTTAVAQGCDRIATGHTMNDQAETVLLRLLRGAGVRGLAAMRPVTSAPRFTVTPTREEGEMQDEAEAETDLTRYPLLIRPLLCLTREEIEAYCRQHGLAFRDDVTNDSRAYTRNRLRHEAMPVLRAIAPRVVERLAHTAEVLAGEEDALHELAARALDEARKEAARGEEGSAGKRQSFAYARAAFLRQPPSLMRRMIGEAIRRARADRDRGKGKRKEIVAAHLGAVERLVRGGASGDRVVLPRSLEVWREFDVIVFLMAPRRMKPRGQRAEEDSYRSLLNPSQPRLEAGGFVLTMARRQANACLREVRARNLEGRQRSGVDWMEVALDEAAIPDELVVRPRRRGETARVLGRGKINKLKKLMIDHKIASSRRATHPVVATLDGDYVWSPGLPPALRFAARDESQSLAILRASPV